MLHRRKPDESVPPMKPLPPNELPYITSDEDTRCTDGTRRSDAHNGRSLTKPLSPDEAPLQPDEAPQSPDRSHDLDPDRISRNQGPPDPRSIALCACRRRLTLVPSSRLTPPSPSVNLFLFFIVHYEYI
ncbi:uncharacterized protein A4U43_C07F22610 [Asparagus officinalis]|uniref:Uncharacterized protein n=1 Tax=Asparagus officinalis TaxID=4686 RepID=A0A5P1EH42_ASPOF|nr:uncharacterized protein A4U43_C07F22610 [Asparagus officinalis]